MKNLKLLFSSIGCVTWLTVLLAFAPFRVWAQSDNAVSNPGPVDNRTVPGAPTSIVAEAGVEQAVVSFLAPSDDGGASITGYVVTASPGGATASGTSSPITVSGLAPGAYTFTVTASNALGVGPTSIASGQVAVVVTAATHSELSNTGPVDNRTVPGAPTAVVAAAGVEQAVVSFVAPSDDGGAAITGYVVTASPGGATASGTSSPITISGLAPGPYTFTVTASNALGVGPASSASGQVATVVAAATHSELSNTGPVDNRTVPGAPTGVVAVAGVEQAVVSFLAPPDDGGAPITGYVVTASPGGATASGTSSPITITGLAPGHYTFTVTASNPLGFGPTSSASGQVAAVVTAATHSELSNTGPVDNRTVPGAPTGVVALAGIGQAVVSFLAPSDDGGASISGYVVTASPGGATVSGTSSPITVSGLGPGAYTFTVTASNALGFGPASSASDFVVPIDPPTAHHISGEVRYYDGTSRVPGVQMSIAGAQSLNTTTGGDGAFVFDLNAGADYSLIPSKLTEVPQAQGITTLDILLIRRHILGFTALDSPYKLLAADVNNSGSITSLDIALIRRVILGLVPTLPKGAWQFVPSDLVFPDPHAPWAADPARRYAALATARAAQDFIGIRVGDVNNSWTPPVTSGSQSLREHSALLTPRLTDSGNGDKRVHLELPSVRVGAGGTVEVPVRMANFKRVTSFQFTLGWNPRLLRFQGIEPEALVGFDESNVNTVNSDQGRLICSWDDPAGTGQTLVDGSVVLRLKFAAVAARPAVSAVRFLSLPTVPEVTVDSAVSNLSMGEGAVWIGTDPEAVALLSPSLQGGSGEGRQSSSISLSFQTLLGVSYALEVADSLSEPLWSPVTGFSGDGGRRVIANLPSTSAQRFYRLRSTLELGDGASASR